LNRTLTTTLTTLAVLAALAGAPARAADPPCIAQCREMAAKKQLRAGVNEQGCVTNLCQQDGRRLYREGQYDAALASYQVLAEKLSRSPSFLLDRGVVYYAQGRFELALGDFDTVIGLVPDSFQGGAERAHTLMRLGRWSDARAQFQKLLDMPGAQREFRGLRTTSYIQGNLGAIDLLSGDYGRGKKELQNALETDGRNSLASSYLYRVLPQLEAKTIDSNGIALLLGASEDVGLGRRDAAKKAIDELLAKYPKFPETYFLAAELYRNSGYYEVCERTLRAGEREVPGDIDLKAERLRCTLLKVCPMSTEAKQPLAELKSLASSHPDNALVQQIVEAIEAPPQ
jgi:tetratricopeptide (TPR) repeat protein